MAPTSPENPYSTATVGLAGWRIFRYGTVASTNDLARDLPAWSAVRAEAQTAGRGRFGRRFVSDLGGLWLSATLPAKGDAGQWSGFSLMVGCHLLRMLKNLAVPDARLRWPNDLMSGKKKLAGLLIEQGSRETLTIGIGMNVLNRPWKQDPALVESSTRLADLLSKVPDLEKLAILHLDAFAHAHQAMLEGGLPSAIRELNLHWANERQVQVTLTTGETVEGQFAGLDRDAHLRIQLFRGHERLVAYNQVAQLTELE
jgi:BirA family biotin operon repressor/biotin-[acetyl-CoA-carboxylase] ligase